MASANYNAYYTSLVDRLQRKFQTDRATNAEAEYSIRGTQPVPDPGDSATLRIGGVYFYPKENGKNHRTSKFELVELGTPVFRRGQSFYVALRTPVRPFDESRDFIKLTFKFGPRPSPLNGTKFNLNAEKKPFDQIPTSWACRIAGHDKNAISIEVRIGSDSCIGIWNCEVESRTLRGGGPQYFTSPEDIYILFNPWDSNDLTHMPDPELLNEYVLEDVGKIWVGPYKSTRGRHWAFGQFDDSVLPVVCILLEKSGLPFTSRGDPILVSRALTKMKKGESIFNVWFQRGILVGRWDEKYQDGKAPGSWTGSVPILEQYFRTLRPVRYGQCWVFSGVLCTVMRALGIPCRVVTNFVSAHDSNCSLTVDIYLNEENKVSDFDPNNPMGGKDSIWNFHVWNDVWMARPDLPNGYGGWQVIDATPQERTDGGRGDFLCGPASVAAVKKGQVGFAYDVPFVLAEVNADLVHWKKDPASPFGFTRMNCNNYHIGSMILTKKPNFYDPNGEMDREEILDQYKSKEGSRSERLTLINAARRTRGASQYFELTPEPPKDFEFNLVELEKIKIGEPFAVVTEITNNGSEIRTVQIDMGSESVYYTGLRAEDVKRATGKFSVAPGKTETLRMTVKPEDYLPKLVEYGIMKITAVCVVDGTSQSWFAEDDFQVIKPILMIEVAPKLKAREEAEVTFRFRNPLNMKLTESHIYYEGPGFTRFETIPLKDVNPLGELKYTHKFIPRAIGTQRWVGTFSSRELVDIVGVCMVEVDP